MANDLYRVPTQGIGPSGEQIFDVFGTQGYIKDPNDPQLKGVDILGLPIGKAPSDFKSQFGIQQGYQETPTLADKLKNEGAVTTSETPSEQSQFFKNMEERLKKSDEYASQLMSLYVPTPEEQKIQAEIDATFGAAEAGINDEADRPASMGFITGAQASIERRANQKLAGLQREIQRLQGNREGQQKAIKAAYDIRHQSVQDALAFYQATAPDQIAIDERSGNVYFRNPVTGEVTSTKLPGYVPKGEDKIPMQEEYEYAKSQGFKGTLMDYQKLKATQFGTETTSQTEAAEITTIQQRLISSMRGGEYVDGNVYLQERTKSKMSPKDFDARFGNMLSPTDRTKYGVSSSGTNTQVVQTKDGKDVLINKDTGEVIKEITLDGGSNSQGTGAFGKIANFFFD